MNSGLGKCLLLVVCSVATAGLVPPCVFAQQRPLITESTDTVPERHLRLELGVEWLRDTVFPLSGLRGDLTRFGEFGLRFGLGKAAEIKLEGVAQDRLAIESRFAAPNANRLNVSGDSTHDVGDLVLGTKFRFVDDKPGRPAVGFQFAVQLPNASNEKGLGNDETNAFAGFLVGKRMGKLQVNGNLGLAILGDPLDAGSQDDLFTYGVSGVFEASQRLNVVADLYGRTGPGGIGTEDQSRLRTGIQVKAAGFYWDAGLFAGFRSTDPDWGIVFGLSRQFAFH